MNTRFSFTLLGLAAVALSPLVALADDVVRADQSATSTAQAADFSAVAPAREEKNGPAINPTPGSLNPQEPQAPNPARKPAEGGTTGADNPATTNSASGLTTPGASSGSSLGPGSNSTLNGGQKGD